MKISDEEFEKRRAKYLAEEKEAIKQRQRERQARAQYNEELLRKSEETRLRHERLLAQVLAEHQRRNNTKTREL